MKLEDMSESELSGLDGGSFAELNRRVGFAVGWMTAALEDMLSSPGSNLAMSPTGVWYARY